jgi:hypothetical protein
MEAEASSNLPSNKPWKIRAKDKKQYGRGKVSNGKALLHGVDGRNPWVKRCKFLIAQHIADRGGIENCSFAEQEIIHIAAVQRTELERIETKFALDQGTDNDLDLWIRGSGNLRRQLETLNNGLERKAKDVTTLAQYLDQKEIGDVDAPPARAGDRAPANNGSNE